MPRTGGTWIRKLMGQGLVKGKIREFSRHIKERDSCINRRHATPDLIEPRGFTFTFVRHPFEWYKSFWKYRTRNGRWIAQNWCELTKTGCASNDFNEFIDLVIKNHPEGYYSNVVKQFLPLDYMGKYENLLNDFITALRLGGENFYEKGIRNFTPMNVSRSVDLRYAPGQKEKLAEIERYVYEIY